MTLQFDISYNVDTSLLFNADQFRELYLQNIPLRGYDAYIIENKVVEQWIRNNQTKAESLLELKVSKHVLLEFCDFVRIQACNYNYIKVLNNILKCISIQSYVNTQKVADIPSTIVYYQQQLDLNRQVYFLATVLYAYFVSNFFLIYYAAKDFIPGFWRIKYLTGFNKIPDDLLDYIGKSALVDAYAYISQIILPSAYSGGSKSVDGVSESFSTPKTANTGIFSAAKKELNEQLGDDRKRVIEKYRPIPTFRI